MPDRSPTRSWRRAAGAATAGLLVLGVAGLPASSAGAPAPSSLDELVTWGDTAPGLSNLDERGSVLPTAAQKAAASLLRAQDVTVRWNDFGTPASVSSPTGDLGAAAGDPATAARTWLAAHTDLLGVSAAQVAGLELVNSQKLADSPARAVLFRQRFGDLTPALGSMVTVGVADGRIAYVSSSLTRTTASPDAAVLTPTQAWLRAAQNVGRDVVAGDVLDTVAKTGWTRLQVAGFAQEQVARLRALAFADGSVRPVFETNVVDVKGGSAFAYTLMVDAVTGRVLHRENQVEQSSDAVPFNGEITATECGPLHPFELTDDATKQINVVASAANPLNDIVVKILGPGGEVLTSGDLLASPETVSYAPGGTLAAGIYNVQVCPFEDPTVPFVGPGAYAGVVTTSDQGGAEVGVPLPRWTYFLANPELNEDTTHVPTNRVTGCWRVTGAEGCDTPPGSLENLAARSPWDHDFTTNLPTFTTVGNAASTHEAWLSPLTPGGLFQAPVSPTREYTAEFTDAWQNSQCDPSQLVPGGNDIDASVTNLFVSHNRMHDYSYFLGFTEANYNMQQKNLGANPDPTRENDPEVGNAQAGALTGGSPSYLGRDNANQIALQDGIPGITNQYLFQPIAGAFYAPCTDGGLDMSIVGHEYTHAISNRMIGGPDEGITSEQGGAMGESWGDLVAGEYLFSHDYSNGANPWAVGPYATGNKHEGIRDYAINDNPLTYADYGFDSTGPEVHADGEIWNGTMWDVRQALVDKWNSSFPYGDKALQLRCARGTATSSPLPADQCPGNRRWVQLMFDAFLLQQGSTSMLDARDAMLAADQMRFGGANQKVLWQAFARNGMGSDASTPTADDSEPTPGWQATGTPSATVTFAPKQGSAMAPGKVYLGRWEARATPSADTLPATPLGSSVKVAPGTYDVLFVGAGTGHTRSTLTVSAGQTVTKTISVKQNVASATSGAKVIASSPGSLNAASLIDDTEASNWAGVNETDGVDVTNPYVVVDLAGGAHTVRTARVSAMLRPAEASGDELPLAAATDDDPGSGSRFTALRKFAIEVCLQSAEVSCVGDDVAWTRIYTSPDNAFPGVRPRPVAPNLALREFDVPDTKATHVRFVALENQCTGYAGYAGELDNDPLNDTDCAAASDADLAVRAAELQLFE
ncbi:M36 family metallopeptidase [Nocardioides iriomotensis]|uniref:Peptidase M36 n=1 Tax=Nocardioides iriomotensis TaxID=715784 RepID=A0A4Q5IU17_9ACTN|nr:M36 family metallopeptidase [Nocardioides iriomotensis]RYU09344.1 peptidase M36 [Nocardioides iriomotensis]